MPFINRLLACYWPLAETEHLTLGYQMTMWPKWLIRAGDCPNHQSLRYCHTLEEALPGSAPSKPRHKQAA